MGKPSQGFWSRPSFALFVQFPTAQKKKLVGPTFIWGLLALLNQVLESGCNYVTSFQASHKAWNFEN